MENRSLKIKEPIHNRLKKYVVNNDKGSIQSFIENLIERELNKKLVKDNQK